MGNMARKRQEFLDDLFDLDLTPAQRETAKKVMRPNEFLVLLYHIGNSGFIPRILSERERGIYKAKDSYPKIIQELAYSQI
jgi:hypothetical protein